MIIIEKSKVSIDKQQLQKYQEDFEKNHVFILPNLFCQSLKPFINSQLTDVNWFINTHSYKSDSEKLMAREFAIKQDEKLYKILNFYLNHPQVTETIRLITNETEIKSFNGRVYKYESRENCFNNWHTDIGSKVNRRLVGISLNLSSMPYEGGEFQIRDKETKQVYSKIKHNKWGAAHFFRISTNLEHIVTNVTGKYPRIACAGWFNKIKLYKQIE